MVPSTDAVQNQDALRIMRAFVGAVTGYTSEQSYAGEDGTVSNPPGQFMVVGPQGVATEGTSTLRTTATGGLVIPPAVILLGAGALFALVVLPMLKRG